MIPTEQIVFIPKKYKEALMRRWDLRRWKTLRYNTDVKVTYTSCALCESFPVHCKGCPFVECWGPYGCNNWIKSFNERGWHPFIMRGVFVSIQRDLIKEARNLKRKALRRIVWV